MRKMAKLYAQSLLLTASIIACGFRRNAVRNDERFLVKGCLRPRRSNSLRTNTFLNRHHKVSREAQNKGLMDSVRLSGPILWFRLGLAVANKKKSSHVASLVFTGECSSVLASRLVWTQIFLVRVNTWVSLSRLTSTSPNSKTTALFCFLLLILSNTLTSLTIIRYSNEITHRSIEIAMRVKTLPQIDMTATNCEILQ